MTDTIQRELWFPQSRQEVWNAIAQSSTLAEWMYPNDFEPRVGHRFTFRVPPHTADPSYERFPKKTLPRRT
jgi:uncharacterized protein YndB with AHSA1/START domain